MSTFDDDERSTSRSRPIDLYTIATPTTTYYLTSHIVNVLYAGNTYLATTMSRGNQQVAQDLTGRELIVYLPITHPLVQRFAASGIPESSVLVTLQRLQAVSGIATQNWQGFGNSLSVNGHVAELRVPSVTDDAMKIKLPVIAAQRTCNHVLYGPLCSPHPGISGPERSAFQISTTLSSQNGTTIIVGSLSGKPDNWAQFGELVHSVTGERRQIIDQTGTTLTVNAPLVVAAAGDNINIFAGCDHNVTTCRDKFANVINFGGMPEMLGTFAPWNPGSGLGLIQQP